MKRAVILIPVYKSSLNKYEQISFYQCLKIFRAHPIILLAPKSLNIDKYMIAMKNILVERFDDHYFIDTRAYSKLLLDPMFYQRFSAYEYMLIYQLDAFVFRDDLAYWCEKGLDYIGAPWFKGFSRVHNALMPWKVGNGGFSLRKTRSMIDMLEIYKNHFLSISEIFDEYEELNASNKIKSFPYLLSQLLGINNNSQEYMKNTQRNEDRVISMCLSKSGASFKVASVDEAIGFSFECDPRYMYQINNNRLPFGCHAWPKYDIEFWRPFIEAQGHKV